MSIKVLQNDILGNKVSISDEKIKEKSPTKPREFKNISILDGNDQKYLESDYMLMLRIMQKRILYKVNQSPKMKNLFLKLIHNEMKLKLGELDSVSATRDSLISYFVIDKC